ncbi:MAG: uroporphyrinogen decarboxylase family protein [Chloroflexi bacterium]|nr:uroporphyrinogen decarboxylase family protein [Chloroflexota bacterium]
MAHVPLTGKQRIHAALEGAPVDRMPVTSLYNQLYILDHFAELTGKEQWQIHEWLIAPPAAHFATYRTIVEQVPFEVLQPQLAAPRRERESTRIVVKDNQVLRHDKRTGTVSPMNTVSGHATDYHANETRYVYTRRDMAEQFKLRTAEQQIADGVNDFVHETVSSLGRDHFILTGGVVGTLYLCHNYVGLTNLYELLISDPALVDYMSQKILEQNIEDIRSHATAGGDAIYIDDATATSDMISVKHYERFCLPYMRQMVDEIHRLGHKAIVIYFGGIVDRLDQIASLGADGLSMETGMKGYTNDVEQIARSIGGRVTLFGNIDPVGVLQSGSDVELKAEIRRQARAKQYARGFIMCTGSPITPFTPLTRVQRFIELAREA